MSRVFQRFAVKNSVEVGSPLMAKENFRMNIVVPAGNASIGSYIHRGLLIEGTFAYPQATVHLRSGDDKIDGLAAETSEAGKNPHYERSVQVSFDHSGFELSTLAVERSRCHGKSGVR